MRNYCTLSDLPYLPKLLAMHESLTRHSSEPFTLHILVMDIEPDRVAWRVLYELQLPNVKVYPLSTFERALHLEKIRESRKWSEFCWGCASSFMEYLMPWVGEVTYLDADLYFFSDPKVIFDEIGTQSIGITPHRFPPEKKYLERNGVFNVGLVHAKDTDAGRRCISEWARKCREWCFAQVEPDRFGDQKYLDRWSADYPGEVCEIANIGVNAAPWNVSQYAVTDGPCVDGKPIVFFHLHEFSSDTLLTHYKLRPCDTKHIYEPYVAAWRAACQRVIEMKTRLDESAAEMAAQAERV